MFFAQLVPRAALINCNRSGNDSRLGLEDSTSSTQGCLPLWST